MGFYTKGKYLPLPSKRIIDDLLEREGLPDEESFTPFNGMNGLIGEQMVGSKFSNIGLDLIKDSVYELDISKLEKSSLKSDSIEDSVEIQGRYLEELNEDLVRNYVLSQLIGIKRNKNAAKDALKEMMNTRPLMYDTETSRVYNQSSTYVDEEEAELYEKYEEADNLRRKIPYLIKKLQEGSIYYSISLLSLFIARDSCINLDHIKSGYIKSVNLLRYPVYKVSSTGHITENVNVESANNGTNYNRPKEIVLGQCPNDPYYRAGLELTSIARQLGYNLYDEDARNYTPEYVNNLMCSYIISNQEVLMDIGVYDKDILALFQDGSLFKSPSDVVQTPRSSGILKLREMAELKAGIIPELHVKLDQDRGIYRKISKPLNLIDQFFTLYKEVNSGTRMEENSVSDCYIENNVLCDSAGWPIIFNVTEFVYGIPETTGFKRVYAIITDEGYVVCVDDSISSCIITDVSSVNYNMWLKKEDKKDVVGEYTHVRVVL